MVSNTHVRQLIVSLFKVMLKRSIEFLVLFENGMFLPVSLHLPFIRYIKIVGRYVFCSRLKKKERKETPSTGLEPAIFGLGGGRVIHYATEASVYNTSFLSRRLNCLSDSASLTSHRRQFQIMTLITHSNYNLLL